MENKRTKASELGATHFFNTKKENLTVSDIDVIIDTTGNPSVIGEMSKYLSKNGRMVLVGQPPPGEDLQIPNGVSMFAGRGKSIKATQGGKTNPTEDIPRYIRMNKAGILGVDKIVTHRFDLDDVKQAFEVLQNGTAGRIMIYMEKQ